MTNQPIKILLIENDLNDTHSIEDIVRQTGENGSVFELETVQTLNDGLKKLNNGKIDLVLLEQTLINNKSKDTFSHFEEKIKGTPIIILSSAADHKHPFEASRNRAQDYFFKKNMDPSAFSRMIYDVVDRHRIKIELGSLTEELRSAYARLEELSLIDPLTELLNRRGLQRVLSRIIQQNQSQIADVLAILIDLDDFKHINNTFGHAVGDVVLKEVAQKLKSCLRGTDYVGRIAGDEFMILLSKTLPEEGKRVAERIRLAISQSITLSSGERVKITASFGMTTVTDPLPTIDDLQSQIQPVLQESKQAGKNCVSYKRRAGDNKQDPIVETLDVLRSGNCFYAVKQPIFHLPTRRRSGYEFLSRSTVKGFEMPDDFFRLSLEANILTLVDHYCFKNCVVQSKSLVKRLFCHLNLFPSTMISIPIQHLIDALPPNRKNYCIEISEQQIIGDPSYLIKPVNALHKAGVLIAIDDVGFGRSCIESLILLEPDILKIDRKWVHGVSQDKTRARALKTLMKIVKSLGVQAIAEGIETEDDLELVKSLGVKYGQGFLLGKPGLCTD